MTGPSMAVPGVYSPPQRKADPSTEQLQTEMRNDDEVGQALDQLVYSLKNGISKAKAFDAFEERMWFLYLRAERRLENA